LIKKPRNVPLILQKYEALLRRLPKDHPKRELIEQEVLKRRAGLEGEKSIDYYLKGVPKERYYIFHNLRLPVEDEYAQFDTILLSHSYILVLEIKNIKGTLYFDQSFHQLIRVKDEKEDGFPDPISQVNRQQTLLSSWLQLHRLPVPPIESLIVISDPSTIIKASSYHKEIFQKVVRASNLSQKIKSFEAKHQVEKLTRKEMNKMSRLFHKEHTPLNSDIVSYFKLSREDILTGVHCPSCSTLPIPKHPNRNKWKCPNCKKEHPHAHIYSLRDYALLINTTITNRECREFLHIQSPWTTARLLRSMNLPYTGSKSHPKYNLPLDE
jgi:Nuclease-related domain